MHTTVVELSGHIIDSRTLPRLMDAVMDLGGDFRIADIRIGRTKVDTSYARIDITAADQDTLSSIIAKVKELGASVLDDDEAVVEEVAIDGVFPEGFYSTTNLETLVRLEGGWVPVENIEMDCAVVVNPDNRSARCVPVHRVRAGDMVVVGWRGVKVLPLERARHKDVFSFMGSQVSSEKPKTLIVRDVAREMDDVRTRGGRILFVVGPAVVHTGAGRHLVSLIKSGYVQEFFAGNAVAVHDVESAFFGTSLGISLESGTAASEGHSHHIRAINRIRAAGGLKEAVASGILTKGIIHALITEGVEFVLAGSIRDDGPLPDVITDVVRAQDMMRTRLAGVELVIMLSSMLHSVAVGNMLPARVRTVCVDINPATVTKLSDRGSHQVVGIVSDVEWFLKELLGHLKSVSVVPQAHVVEQG